MEYLIQAGKHVFYSKFVLWNISFRWAHKIDQVHICRAGQNRMYILRCIHGAFAGISSICNHIIIYGVRTRFSGTLAIRLKMKAASCTLITAERKQQH